MAGSSSFNSLVQGLLTECQNSFSEDSVYYVNGDTGNNFEIRGIFEDRSEINDLLSEAGAVVSSPEINYHVEEITPLIELATAGVRDTPNKTDTILLRGKTYNIISVEPDERGDITLKIQEIEI